MSNTNEPNKDKKQRLSDLIEELKSRYCREHGIEKISYRGLASAMTEAGYPISHTPLRQYTTKKSEPGPSAIKILAGYTGQGYADLEQYLDGACTLSDYLAGRCQKERQPINVDDVLLWTRSASSDDLVTVINGLVAQLSGRLSVCQTALGTKSSKLTPE